MDEQNTGGTEEVGQASQPGAGEAPPLPDFAELPQSFRGAVVELSRSRNIPAITSGAQLVDHINNQEKRLNLARRDIADLQRSVNTLELRLAAR